MSGDIVCMVVCPTSLYTFYVANNNITRFNIQTERDMSYTNKDRVGHTTIFSEIGKVTKIVLDSWKRMLIWNIEDESGAMRFAYGNADGSPIGDDMEYFVYSVGEVGVWSYSPVERQIFYHVVGCL